MALIINDELSREIFVHYKGQDHLLGSVLKIGRNASNDIVIENINARQCEIHLNRATGGLKLYVYGKTIGVHLIKAQDIKDENVDPVTLPLEKVGKFLKVDKSAETNYVESEMHVGDILYFKDSLLRKHLIEIKETLHQRIRSRADYMKMVHDVEAKTEASSNKIDDLNRKIFEIEKKKRELGIVPPENEGLKEKIRFMIQKIAIDKKEFEAKEKDERATSHGHLNQLNTKQREYQKQHENIQAQIRSLTWSSDSSTRPKSHPNDSFLVAGKHSLAPHSSAPKYYLSAAVEKEEQETEDEEDPFQQMMGEHNYLLNKAVKDAHNLGSKSTEADDLVAQAKEVG